MGRAVVKALLGGAGLAALMGAAPADVVVTGAERQGANATVVHFKVLSPLGNAEALYGRLNNSGVTSALQGVWPSIVNANLGDALPAPPPPIGTYTVLTQGQTIAFDTLLTVWQTSSFSFLQRRCVGGACGGAGDRR